jgi:hypothetical protein
MSVLFNLFLDICLFRKGPQHVPASWVLLKLSLLAYAFSGLLVLLVGVRPLMAISQTLLDVALLAGLTYAVLSIQGYQIRYVQTLTALAGTGALLWLMVLPVVIWITKEVTRGEPAELPKLLFWLLVGWSIAIMSHILRYALSVSRGVSVLYTLGYVIISMILSEWLFPVS